MAKQSGNWIIVDDLMREVMEALAHGHAALVERSESPLGRLAVKTAELTLDFDLSAKAKTDSETFSLQVKPTPLFGFFTQTNNETTTRQVELRNHAQIVIQIVNVPPHQNPQSCPTTPTMWMMIMLTVKQILKKEQTGLGPLPKFSNLLPGQPS